MKAFVGSSLKLQWLQLRDAPAQTSRMISNASRNVLHVFTSPTSRSKFSPTYKSKRTLLKLKTAVGHMHQSPFPQQKGATMQEEENYKNYQKWRSSASQSRLGPCMGTIPGRIFSWNPPRHGICESAGCCRVGLPASACGTWAPRLGPLPPRLRRQKQRERWAQQWPRNHVLPSPASPHYYIACVLLTFEALMRRRGIMKAQQARTLIIGVPMTPWPWPITWHIASSRTMTARPALMSPALVRCNSIITSTIWHGAFAGMALCIKNILCYTQPPQIWLQTPFRAWHCVSLRSCDHMYGPPHRSTLCQPHAQIAKCNQNRNSQPIAFGWRCLTGCGIFTATSACSPQRCGGWCCSTRSWGLQLWRLRSFCSRQSTSYASLHYRTDGWTSNPCLEEA